jgi:hypothetical protein
MYNKETLLAIESAYRLAQDKDAAVKGLTECGMTETEALLWLSLLDCQMEFDRQSWVKTLEKL